jgi:hypothetical protein
VVTVDNTGAATEMPLTGTTVGSPCAASQSGWTVAPPGTSTYTALASWPAPPTVPVVVQVPGGPAPNPGHTSMAAPSPRPATPGGSKQATAQQSVCIQVPLVTGHVTRRMKVTVFLKCKAALLSNYCSGILALTAKRQTITVRFRIEARKIARITIKLPKRARAAAKSKKHPTLHAKLKITTKQAYGPATITRAPSRSRRDPARSASRRFNSRGRQVTGPPCSSRVHRMSRCRSSAADQGIVRARYASTPALAPRDPHSSTH